VNTAERLAEYAHSLRFEDLSQADVVEAKKRLIDGLGCAIGAFEAPPVVISRRLAGTVSSVRPATLLGTTVKTSPEMATFVNGVMVRYLDYNDTYLGKEPAHPSDNISTALAVAESEGASGKDFLLALVLAYEIQCRLCDLADIRHRGWDHVNYGLVSTSLASGKLLGLDTSRLTEAVNIALNPHIAMRQVRVGRLSMWKGASFAEAARNGVFSALLAKEGMTGPSPIFEGEMGFFRQVSGPFKLDLEAFGGRRGSFKISQTYIKYFPAEYHSQSAIWAAIETREGIRGLEDIESVLVESHEAGFSILGNDPAKWNPTTRETADHSLPYIVTLALRDGKIDENSYSEANIRYPRLLEFMKKVSVREDKGLSSIYPQAIANRVTLRLKSRGYVSREVRYPKGHPSNPMSADEIEAKFRRLAGRYLEEGQMNAILGKLWSVEKLGSLSELLQLMQVRRDGPDLR